MLLFPPKSEECTKMSFKEFKNRVMQEVRSKNHKDLIDEWEKHIIFKDFEGVSLYGSTFFGTIYYADKTAMNELTIRIYAFSYHEISDAASFSCTECSLYKEEIDTICKISQCFSASKESYFGYTLDSYHSAGMEVK